MLLHLLKQMKRFPVFKVFSSKDLSLNITSLSNFSRVVNSTACPYNSQNICPSLFSVNFSVNFTFLNSSYDEFLNSVKKALSSFASMKSCFPTTLSQANVAQNRVFPSLQMKFPSICPLLKSPITQVFSSIQIRALWSRQSFFHSPINTCPRSVMRIPLPCLLPFTNPPWQTAFLYSTNWDVLSAESSIKIIRVRVLASHYQIISGIYSHQLIYSYYGITPKLGEFMSEGSRLGLLLSVSPFVLQDPLHLLRGSRHALHQRPLCFFHDLI